MNLIVFDIDDTLTKSEQQHQWAFVKTMEYFGIPVINQNWKEYKHYTDSYILKKNLKRTLDASFVNAFEKQMTIMLLSLKATSEISGAKKFVDYLTNSSSYVFSCATGSLLQPALVKLNRAGINFNEKLVVGSNEIQERENIVKESIERAKRFYNISFFENIILIGDGIWDLHSANKLGLHFIAIGMKNYLDFNEKKIKVHIKNWNGFNLSLAENKLGICTN